MNERLQAIDAAIQYIESHLCDPIKVADIAAAAGYSLYHFIRTFNQSVQHTPYDYLMRRRLSKAAQELLVTERRVIDIALDFQFNNHETFTRAFGRVFGMSPSRWREARVADPRFLMPALDESYLEFLTDPEFKAPELIKLDEFVLAGLMTPITTDPEGIPPLWRNLRGILRGLPLPSDSRDFWGIRMPSQIPAGDTYYFAGVKIPDLDFPSSALATKIIPAGDYLCFQLENPTANLSVALAYLYHTFLPKTAYTLADPLEIEHFGAQCEILVPLQGLQPSTKA
jgi:AraC family transcriptional regulator